MPRSSQQRDWDLAVLRRYGWSIDDLHHTIEVPGVKR